MILAYQVNYDPDGIKPPLSHKVGRALIRELGGTDVATLGIAPENQYFFCIINAPDGEEFAIAAEVGDEIRRACEKVGIGVVGEILLHRELTDEVRVVAQKPANRLVADFAAKLNFAPGSNN